MEYWIKFNELGAVGWTIVILWTVFSFFMAYWSYKRKGVVGLLFALFLNWVGWIIVACLPKNKPERERE